MHYLGTLGFMICVTMLNGHKGVLEANEKYKNGCTYSCGTDSLHTMCMSEGTASKCENLKLSPTSRLKEEVLVWHNLFRSEFAEGKTTRRYVPEMQKMYWDDELEEMARIWVSQCEPANDRCRKLADNPLMLIMRNTEPTPRRNARRRSSRPVDSLETTDFPPENVI